MTNPTQPDREWVPPVVKPERIERIEHPDGRVSTVIHMPVLTIQQVRQQYEAWKQAQQKEPSDG